MVKTFGQLTDKDSIYYISPVTLQIEGFKIKTISGVAQEKIKKQPILKSWVKLEVFSNTLALQSPDIESIPTQVFYFDGNHRAQIALVETLFGKDNQVKVPVLFTTSINTLKEWMKLTL